jgi:type I restriction enzyme S subunit
VVIPDGWVQKTITEIAEVNKRDPSLRSLSDDLSVTFVPMAAIDAEKGLITDPRTSSFGKVKKGFTSFREGDVIFAKITPCMENGKAAIARGLINGVGFGSTEFHVIRPNNEVIPDYIFYFLRQESFRNEAKANFSGTAGQLRVKASFIENTIIPVPPLPEQERIVERIESLFTQLDAGVAALKRAQAALKRYRASVLKAACEGRLVPQDPNDEPAEELLQRILAEKGQKYTPVQAEGLAELPKGWCWATSNQLLKFVTSGSRGWAKYYSDDGAVFFRIGNLNHGSITLDLRNIQRVSLPTTTEGMRTRVEENDILVSITADVGMVGLVNGLTDESYINQHIALARPVKSINAKYLAWFLTSEIGQKQLKDLQRGATKMGLGLDDIKNVIIPLPPSNEQLKIITELERRLSVVQEMEAAVTAGLARASRLRQAILKLAFEGRLVPSEN